MKTLYDIIARQAFFRGLSQEHVHTLADNAMQMWFEAGELIFHDGDLANRFYLISEVMMQRLQIARGRFLDHLATCGAASSARARTRGTAAARR